jgi:hypothetical protein
MLENHLTDLADWKWGLSSGKRGHENHIPYRLGEFFHGLNGKIMEK